MFTVEVATEHPDKGDDESKRWRDNAKLHPSYSSARRKHTPTHIIQLPSDMAQKYERNNRMFFTVNETQSEIVNIIQDGSTMR